MWDAFDNERLNYEAAHSALRDAQAALESATDELDRAEAQEAIDEAHNAISRARKNYESTRWQAGVNDLDIAFSVHRDKDDSTQGVVRSRAWEAFLTKADANTLAIIAAFDEAEAAEEEAILAAESAEGETALDLEAQRREVSRSVTAARDARWDVMERNVAEGTPAYIAFRLSFQESCQ